MRSLDIYKLEKLLDKYEGPKLDFKAKLKLETDSDKKEFTKDIIAIANSKGGRGYIIFGIEDKTKRVIGIEPNDFEEEKIQQIICNRVDPPISIAVDILAYKGRSIAVLTIFRSLQQPHQMIHNGAFYIRRGSTTDYARREELASMFQHSGLISYEQTILRKATISDLDKNLLNNYLHHLGVSTDKPSEVILEGLGIIKENEETGEFNPTIGGIILFGKETSLLLPHVYIKVIFNEDKFKYFYGNVNIMLTEVEEYLKGILESNYPYDALFRIIANAIIHRDYTDISRGITIEITEKNIVVSNPGALMEGNLIYKIEKDKDTRKRNIWLYHRLINLGNEKYFKEGFGILKIKESIKDAKFLNLGSQNLFKVILPR